LLQNERWRRACLATPRKGIEDIVRRAKVQFEEGYGAIEAYDEK